jgi:hypothetical protein
MVAPEDKSELLSKIEEHWEQAEVFSEGLASSAFQRISILMEDAIVTELMDAQKISPFFFPFGRKRAGKADDKGRKVGQGPGEPLSANAPFEEIKAQMDKVAKLKQPDLDAEEPQEEDIEGFTVLNEDGKPLETEAQPPEAEPQVIDDYELRASEEDRLDRGRLGDDQIAAINRKIKSRKAKGGKWKNLLGGKA